MSKATDIDPIRDLAIVFLYLDVEKTEIPFIIKHPYSDSPYITIPGEGKPKIYNIADSPKDLDIWRRHVRNSLERMITAREFVNFITKSFRIAFFIRIRPYLSSEDLGSLLRQVWTSVEFPNHDPNISKAKFVDFFRKAGIQNICNAEERRFIGAVSDQKGLVVYRGTATDVRDDIFGLSWTSDIEVARWFAERFGQDGSVHKARIGSSGVLAFFSGSESEVVVDPKMLVNVEKIEREAGV